MKIATYNIWNSDVGMPLRRDQTVNEIIGLNADLLCLQEMKSQACHREIANACSYKYSCFSNHPNEDEGLSIFSRFPIDHHFYLSNAMIASVKIENCTVLIVNLHLPWDSAIKREESIVKIIKTTTSMKSNFQFILGDFNCSDHSSVQGFLLGDRSLLNAEANPCWYDLATAYAEITDTALEATLNFRENPRWKGNNSIETNQRFDRILMRSTYPNEFPTLKTVSIFGKNVSEGGYCASDHYGVCAELTFPLYT